MVIHLTHRRDNRGTDIHIQVAQQIIILFFFSYWRIHVIWRPGEERYVTLRQEAPGYGKRVKSTISRMTVLVPYRTFMVTGHVMWTEI